MPLSQSQASSLLAGSAKQSKAGFWCDQGGTIHQGIAPSESIGTFVGRVGTMRRTSKGATRRNLDGSRRYIAGGIIEEEVAYYIIKR